MGKARERAWRLMRCRRCRKHPFHTKEEADAFAAKMAEKGIVLFSYYAPRCAWWHLTSQLNARG